MINLNTVDLSSVYKETPLTAKLENSKDDKELMEACEEFESYFLTLMMKEMRKTINYSDGYIKRNRGEEIFTDMLDEELSGQASKTNSGMGLAKVLYEQMKKRS